jgi:hypothetical protein
MWPFMSIVLKIEVPVVCLPLTRGYISYYIFHITDLFLYFRTGVLLSGCRKKATYNAYHSDFKCMVAFILKEYELVFRQNNYTSQDLTA